MAMPYKFICIFMIYDYLTIYVNYEARAADQQGCSSNHYENILKYILIHFNLT